MTKDMAVPCSGVVGDHNDELLDILNNDSQRKVPYASF